jgi:hypothetical protein
MRKPLVQTAIWWPREVCLEAWGWIPARSSFACGSHHEAGLEWWNDWRIMNLWLGRKLLWPIWGPIWGQKQETWESASIDRARGRLQQRTIQMEIHSINCYTNLLRARSHRPTVLIYTPDETAPCQWDLRFSSYHRVVWSIFTKVKR